MQKQDLLIFMNVAIASGLALLVGFEREMADKPAGMKTNLIVGGFTCLIVSLAPKLNSIYRQEAFYESLSVDPVRILQAIVLGVSFIGAGTIVKSNGQAGVSGITTAATLLYSCGIGISVGLGHYVLAVLLTVFILTTNFVIGKLVAKFRKKPPH